MLVIVLYGSPGVGKLTVGRTLAPKLGLKLLHNHLVIDLVEALYEFGTRNFIKLRKRIWWSCISEGDILKNRGFIVTIANDKTLPLHTLRVLDRALSKIGAKSIFIELQCDEPEVLRRLSDPSRKKYNKLNSIKRFRELSKKGAFRAFNSPRENIVLKTTNLSIDDTCEAIMNKLFLMPDKLKNQIEKIR